MNSNEFVEAIKIAVEQSSLQGMKYLLTSPPGSKPDADVLRRSDWYKSLSEENKSKVIEVVEESIKIAVFGFFCVLDGVRAIENEGKNGDLNLYFEKDGDSILLNNPDDEYLHNLYNATF